MSKPAFRDWLKRKISRVRIGVFVVLFFCYAGPVISQSQETAQFLLFDRQYLRDISPPATLYYRYIHETINQSALGPNFEDRVILKILPPEEGQTGNRVTIELIRDDAVRRVGPIVNAFGNPVLMVFLERDLFATRRHVRGSPAFFRNAMRRAMRSGGHIESTDITHGGAVHAAKTITVWPYKGQKLAPRFRILEEKSYVFTVSDGIPGGIVRIESRLPEPGNSSSILAVERLTFIEQREN